ncbi:MULTISPECIES: hypothetical protein [Salinivibrio]|jgi:hypothetical protein|nr:MULTISPECIES: hypothetical protein [Salinivibrio]NUY55718.1 hypothetical protein [Salinivibrio sp. EAGSL]
MEQPTDKDKIRLLMTLQFCTISRLILGLFFSVPCFRWTTEPIVEAD